MCLSLLEQDFLSLSLSLLVSALRMLDEIDKITKMVFLQVVIYFYSTFAYDLLLCSLFDDGNARYQKLRESISQFTVTQIGVLLYMPF